MSFPKGYKATGLNCGIKKEKSDLAVVVSDVPAAAAAVYTTNLFQAAPLQVTKNNLLKEGKAQAVVVNSGVANAAMGKQGVADSEKVAGALAKAYDLPAHYTIVASTGVIGMPLPVDKIVSGIEQSKTMLAPLDEGADLDRLCAKDGGSSGQCGWCRCSFLGDVQRGRDDSSKYVYNVGLCTLRCGD